MCLQNVQIVRIFTRFDRHICKDNLAGTNSTCGGLGMTSVRVNVDHESKFPLEPSGVLAPGSAHARSSAQPPIDTRGNFPAHMSAESPSNISPNR